MSKNSESEEEELLMPEEADVGQKKKGKLKKIIIILVPILLLVMGAAYFFFFVIKAPKAEEIVEEESGKPKYKANLEQNAYLDVDPIIVGLTAIGPKREDLKLDMTLRVGNEKESQAIIEKMPLIKDSLIMFLRSLRSSDFNSSSSTIYLREEITKRINKIVAPLSVKEVLFQEITVN